MRYFSFIAILLFSFLLPVSNWGNSPSELLVQDGIHAMYNYEFDNAIAILDSAWKIDNTHPVSPFVLIAAKWLRTQTNKGYDASYETINIEVDATVPIYKSLISKYPYEGEYYLYLGSTFGIRARTALARKAWMDVLYYGYKGLKHIRKAQSIDDKLLDVNMPIGLMQYFACLSPTPIKWGAKLSGISSDCKLGLKNLEIAAKESHYSWIEASNVLTYIYLHIDRDYFKAAEVISPLVEKFPGHPYFAFLKGELLAKTGKWDELERMMPKFEMFASSGPFLKQNECQLKLAYIRALKAFYHGDYTTAIDKCSWVLNNYHMEFDWLKGFAHLLRGKSYDILGKRKLSVRDYKEVLEMDEYYPEVKEAIMFLNTPFFVSN